MAVTLMPALGSVTAGQAGFLATPGFAIGTPNRLDRGTVRACSRAYSYDLAMVPARPRCPVARKPRYRTQVGPAGFGPSVEEFPLVTGA